MVFTVCFTLLLNFHRLVVWCDSLKQDYNYEYTSTLPKTNDEVCLLTRYMYIQWNR